MRWKGIDGMKEPAQTYQLSEISNNIQNSKLRRKQTNEIHTSVNIQTKKSRFFF